MTDSYLQMTAVAKAAVGQLRTAARQLAPGEALARGRDRRPVLAARQRSALEAAPADAVAHRERVGSCQARTAGRPTTDCKANCRTRMTSIYGGRDAPKLKDGRLESPYASRVPATDVYVGRARAAILSILADEHGRRTP